MSSRDSVGSLSNSSSSSRSSYTSSSGSFSSITRAISSTFSGRSTPLPESPTSSLPSPQDKTLGNVLNVTYLESSSSNESFNHQIPTRTKLPTVIPAAQNGPSALARLQDVQSVFCVAFGIFDRYYIAWEDNKGEQHQESNKLPQLLYDWLYPESGQTRHLPSLQVSFGTNDEFFASDKNDKISSRDSLPSVINHVSRMTLTKPIVRTNSQPILNRNEAEENTPTTLQASRLKRRSTLFTLNYQAHNPTRNTIDSRETLEKLPSRTSIAENPLSTYITRNNIESHWIEPESHVLSGLSRRRSVKVNLPRIRTSWSEQPTQDSNILNREIYNSERNYIDACMQTDLCGHHLDEVLSTEIAPPILPQGPQYQPVQTMPFGLMQDYFRGQYSLGDALYYG
ncbi:hypothetical protein BCIN_04g01230 [Botrytis cinerea B05.10]|uniref:Uncharacterized protein n=2 Tax=Botryotinia fuckeliana TaxID=40559 RepID=A0A384JEK4_BOTFB|nr:hypothetical protein BCIN_04g01230 [Botrytis cinerea B05.10]ATZ48912.1 hypothetical protein BCIN_04g01230 [Botrytis cinerea B05.10]CCD46837.1 hypothetical protein BofuT4_P115430.1 [Botrytis cinerea T4]